MPDVPNHPITTGDEGRERDLNRHRDAERLDARADATARLRERGIAVDDQSSAEIVELLEAVEVFERTVEARGGDLMMDTAPAREPDDERFVLPKRGADEAVAGYAARVREAARRLLL